MGLRTSLACLVVLASLASCREREPLTAIVVAVDSDIDDLSSVTIDVKGLGEQPLAEARLGPKDEPLPRTLGLVHRGGPLGPITITVEGKRGADTVVVERRARVFFVDGEAMMLRINLLDACIALSDSCDAMETCGEVEGTTGCRDLEVVPSELEPWAGDVPVFAPNDKPKPRPDAGGQDEPEPVCPADGDVVDRADGDCPPQPAGFPFVPSNFDHSAPELSGDRREKLTVDCDATFDSGDGGVLVEQDLCGVRVRPFATVQTDGATEAVVLPLSGLTIADGARLRFVGARPVILAVYGDATIDGMLDASAAGSEPGPGGDLACDAARGTAGTSLDGSGGGGGGGGGFGTTGAPGGAGGHALSEVPGGAGGGTRGHDDMEPLLGGCGGGEGGGASGTGLLQRGGNTAGGGGGGLQLSVMGTLRLGDTAVIAAAGGGGQSPANEEAGGGGGGSGGAILLEANAIKVAGGAWVSANGGGGGQGNETNAVNGDTGADGAPASDVPAAGGHDGSRLSGPGGAGATGTATAQAGDDGDQDGYFDDNDHGGGGGGGGVGRIRVRGQAGCELAGAFSPSAITACP